MLPAPGCSLSFKKDWLDTMSLSVVLTVKRKDILSSLTLWSNLVL